MKINQLYLSLQGLCAYQNLQQDPLMQEVIALLGDVVDISAHQQESAVVGILNRYGRVFSLLRQENYKGLGDYLWDRCRFGESLYGKLVSTAGSDPALAHSARREVETLISLAKLDCDVLLEPLRPCIPLEDQGVLGDMLRWSSHCPFDYDLLHEYHEEWGYGKFAKDRHFVWREHQLVAVSGVKPRQYQAMQGYETQRTQVWRNTKVLVSGEKAQNILLYGEGGTGKSAVVKSMTWEFPQLRLIQAERGSFATLPKLMSLLGAEPYPFVIFIDDLAFDVDDDIFSAMKSALEGGLEMPPENVVVYATSNRRHLVRQTFSERAGEEVDMMETIMEKTALSERFGLRIPYMSMDKKDYLALVDYLSQEQGMTTGGEVHHQAMMWEIRHGGRTPRVAEQFVNSRKEG